MDAPLVVPRSRNGDQHVRDPRSSSSASDSMQAVFSRTLIHRFPASASPDSPLRKVLGREEERIATHECDSSRRMHLIRSGKVRRCAALPRTPYRSAIPLPKHFRPTRTRPLVARMCARAQDSSSSGWLLHASNGLRQLPISLRKGGTAAVRVCYAVDLLDCPVLTC